MFKRLGLIIFFACNCFILHAQFFTGTGGTIPNNGPAVNFPIVVSGLPLNVIDSNYGVESVCLNITHNNVADLTIQLMAPDGTIIDLSIKNGGTGNNYSNTCFNNYNINMIEEASAPFNGNFRPQGMLGDVNNGQNGNGMWNLRIQDHGPAVIGSLVSWNLTFSTTPALPFNYTSSDLPIVVINTNGLVIPDDPKIVAHMGIIDNGFGNRNYLTDSFNIYNANIGIELRGSWSQTFPQKQYGFETLDSLNQTVDTVVMGMPSENDWILNAPYNDKTCMRNVLVYDIANKTGHYASRTRYCEVMLNGNYQGIYVMMEKVKRDENRVDISKLLPTDTSAVDITGGYIIKIDKVTGSGGGAGWNSLFSGIPGTPIHFQYEYPDAVTLVPKQKTYIKLYVDSFEKALNASWFLNVDSGYKKYIDLQSFVDYFILNETCKNVDSYRLSTFLYKQKITKGGKLVIGPAWDYNIAFRNADYCAGMQFSGWQYQYNTICGTSGGDNVPFWWTKMLQDPAYTSLLKCRWQELRATTLNTDTLLNMIDSIATVLDEAKDRHFFKWPVLGVQTWANPSPIPADYAGEISSMKAWIQARMAWLDGNMPGTCVVTSASTSFVKNGSVSVFPNPFKDRLYIRLDFDKTTNTEFSLSDVSGRIVRMPSSIYITAGIQEMEMNKFNTLPPGIYFLKVLMNDDVKVVKLVKE